MTRLRDDAVGKPGAHAHGAAPGEGGRGRGDLPEMGARLRRSSAAPPTTSASASLRSGEEVANLPIKELGDAGAGIRPALGRAEQAARRSPRATSRRPDVADALLKLIGSPDLSSRAAGSTSSTTPDPGQHAAAAGRRRRRRPRRRPPTKALAFSSDVTPRYCEADPFEGGKQAVAECWRNLTAVGAEPLAATDNLNFGNPERPEIMGQFVRAIAGHRRGLPRARLPDRLGQRLALQRDQRPRHPADARRSAASA